MTIREDIFNVLNDWFDMPKEDFDRAWPDLRRVMNIPKPTTQEQFLEFPVGQMFTVDVLPGFTLIKTGKDSLVRIAPNGYVQFFDYIFVGGFAHWTERTYELKAIED